MMTASCLYEGRVRHRRNTPSHHSFSQRLFMLYLDLDELPTLFQHCWMWSADRPSFAWIRRADHTGVVDVPLADAVRELVQQNLGGRPNGAFA